MHAISWRLTPNEKLSARIANRLLATQHDFPDPRTQAIFPQRVEYTEASGTFERYWRVGYPDWKEAWNDEWLLAFQCAKAVLDEAFNYAPHINYAPHNEAPVIAQLNPEVGKSSEEIASSESRDVVSENDIAFVTGTDEVLDSSEKIRRAYSV